MKVKILLVLLMLCGVQYTQAQGAKEITGTVTDDENVPLPGVNVTVEGTTTGTSTDFDGNYTVEAEEGATLVFSIVGFDDQAQTVGDESSIDVVMEAGQALDEVVVVGYGTQKAKDVSTAISSVKSEDFKKGIVADPIEQVQGKVPGLVITTPSGDPNESKTIRLRGQASLTGGQDPLIVLNGVPLDDSGIISNIPAEDIESYDVLKDASATAIYGSRGANGVIMIETKKGKKGKSEINYSSRFGVSSISKKYDMLNAEEWKETAKDLGASQETIDSRDEGGNTNWLDALTRVATTHSHNVNFSGGDDDFNFYGSLNYLDQEGIIKNTGKEQMGVNFYGEKKAFDDKLSLKLGILNTDTKREYVDGGIFPAAYNSLPVYPTYNDDGSYYSFSDFDQFNPVEHQEKQLNNGKEYYNVIHGGLDYNLDDLIDGLSVGVTGSISRFNRKMDWFKPTFPAENNINEARKEDRNRNSKKGDVHINYSQDWGDHHFDASLVHEYSDYTTDFFTAQGRQFPVEDNKSNALENGDPQFNKIESYKDRYNLSSFLGRFSYNYASKYYVNVSYRRDGSSKFGKNNRWGSFPAFSFAWRLSNENFLEGASWVNDLKLRAGYGVTGNQDAIDPYRTQRLLGSLGRYYDGSTDSYPLAYGPEQNDNPDLKWEEMHGANVGLDFSLFDRKLIGNLNYFHRKTKNLLFTYNVPVPPFYVNNILANVGDMANKGFEAQLEADIIDTGDFTWTASGQITFINTDISNLSGGYSGFDLSTDNVEAGVAQGRGLTSYPITYLREGSSPYTFYLPEYIGIDGEGRQLFSDGEGGEVTQDDLKTDMYDYYDPSPNFSYGFGSTLTYKNWGLNFFMRGVSGQKLFNNTRLILDNTTRMPGNNITRRGAESGIKDGPVPSDRWLEDASYLRMDNLTLSYDFEEIPIFDNLQVSASANNLFVLTSYHGLDPEIRVADSDQAYIDANDGDDGYYPKDRSFSIGFNVTF